ncbi:lysoplasmalogenase [Aliiroseovarius sp. KMU-50]|uniref:Lysoplasmalogenase n=1 Tax=Aliiroseovarius salicola TaxID=3009082 RepID=A0ABT4VZ17_9RHOB|nr:lysoplasmalogenase [Aliiroseovarius sp. KMU-50]MDA5093503.1 lysoplasmalogenase [Aliiroseovarius sp. KMU-50]
MTMLPIYLGLAIALAYLPFTNTPASWRRSIHKTLPLLLFALAGFLTGSPVFLVAGLFLSALGDFGLSRDGESAFLYGLSAFALAHVLYIIHFLALAQMPLWDVFSIAPIPAIALLALLVSTEIWLAPHTGPLGWPVRIYVLVIGAMGLSALLLPFGISTMGAALFILSDLILAIELFRMREDHPSKLLAGYLIWGFYIAGQAMILMGGITI